MYNEIYHHGIKGMHWYVRRYQNADGSLTPAGQKRYEKHEEKKREALASGNAKKIAKYRSELTEEEIKEAIGRIDSQTSLARAIENQNRITSDKVQRITGVVKNTLNNVVDIYDTGAAIANATGLLENELPVLFKDQKRRGVTLTDRGLERRVQSGTATQEEERRYNNDRSNRLERGTLSDAEESRYRQELERREQSGSMSDRDRSDLQTFRQRGENRQRSILTPTSEDYSQERADDLNRRANTLSVNNARLEQYARAAADIYGANDQRTRELNAACRAFNNARVITEQRAGAYNIANPNANRTRRQQRNIDRAIQADAAYRRARTPEERRERDRELARRAREVDDAYSAIGNIDVESLISRNSDLSDAANYVTAFPNAGSHRVSVSTHGMNYREQVRIARERRGISHSGVKGMHWGERRYQNPDGTLTPQGKKHYRKMNKLAKKEAKEMARAKMFYGEGAGTRRKLIKAKVEENMKDEMYAEAFEKWAAQQDMGEHADKAVAERKRKDAKKKAERAVKKASNLLLYI